MDAWTDSARARVAINMGRHGLSPQQQRIAWAMFGDLNAAEIGYALGMAESTVRNYTQRIADKLGTTPSRMTIVLRLLDVAALAEGATMQPQPNDELFIGRDEGGNVTEAFRRTPGGNVADITNDVERVDVNNEFFTVYGKARFPGIAPWTATADRDPEATDAMLRGVVRFSDSAGWAL